MIYDENFSNTSRFVERAGFGILVYENKIKQHLVTKYPLQ
jgi:hypothetical protein